MNESTSPTPTPAQPMSVLRSIVAHTVALLLFLIGYVALTWPALEQFSTHLFGDGGDTGQNLWNIWWVHEAVTNLDNPWFTHMLYNPPGVSLIGATLAPFNGFLAVALLPFLNLVETYNTVVIFSFVMTGYTTFLLVRYMTQGSYWPAVFAGFAFTFCSFHMAHGVGHLQLVSLEWLPLFFLAFLRLLDRPTVWRGICAGLALFLVILCDYYFTLYCVLGGTILAMWRFGIQPRLLLDGAMIRGMVSFVVVCLLTCGPIGWALMKFNNPDDPLVGAHEEHLFVNDVFGPLIIGKWSWLAGLTAWIRKDLDWPGEAEFTNHISFVVLFFALYALLRIRRAGWIRALIPWLLIAVAFYLFSLGSLLKILGREYPGAPTPYDGLKILIPPLKLSGVPVRMSVMYLFAGAILAGFGVQRFFRLKQRRVWLLVPTMALFWATLMIPKQPTWRWPDSPVVEKLRDLPMGTAIGFPYGSTALVYQTIHRKPIHLAYLARFPESQHVQGCHVDNLIRDGKWDEARRLTKARYLVWRLDRGSRSSSSPDFICIHRDTQFELYVHRSDELAKLTSPTAQCGSVGKLRVLVNNNDGAVSIDIRSPGDHQREFAVLFSQHKHPNPAELGGGQSFGLVRDRAFLVSMTKGNTLFPGNLGTIDAQGRGQVEINTQKLKEMGVSELWFSVVIRRIPKPRDICRITPPQKLKIE